jgi:hypothetical protein
VEGGHCSSQDIQAPYRDWSLTIIHDWCAASSPLRPRGAGLAKLWRVDPERANAPPTNFQARESER